MNVYFWVLNIHYLMNLFQLEQIQGITYGFEDILYNEIIPYNADCV